MGDIVYRIKSDADLNKLGELGWDVIPNEKGELTFLKFAVQPINGELVKQLLDNYYKNEEWKKLVYKNYKKEFKDKIGLRYDKKGNIVPSKKFNKALTHWILEINENDKWIGFQTYDPLDMSIYYAKVNLDKYCEEDIKILKENDLIEEFEVTE